jgi:VWFA-related protein
MRRGLAVVWLVSGGLWAQQTGQNAPPGEAGAATFRANTELVVETVSVTDKKGRPVEGLTAKDFQVTEDGVPQEIRFFEYQKLPEAPESAPARQPEHLHIYDKLGRDQIHAEKPGTTRYRDRRLLALYFDMTSMPAADQVRALGAAQRFVRGQMTAADRVAILRYEGGAVEVLQDFTADRDRLLSILETMIVGEGQGLDDTVSDASAPDTGAAFGQDDTEFNIFNTDRQLSALQTAAAMLGQLSEKKLLLYFASGLRLNGLNNQAQLHATINAAIRAGVSIWPVDARGLVAQAPMGDATHGSPGTVAMYSGAGAAVFTTDFQQSQDTLYALASDTGGKAMFDENDLARGIVRAERSIESYYILGYYTTNTALDGRFRRIRITLGTDAAAKLDYRHGYFAGKQFSKFTAAEKERQLEDALMLPDPVTELTIAMEIDYFQLNRAEYFVPVVVKIPGRELALAKRGGAERTLIDFIGEIKDGSGTTIANVRDKVNVKLSDATAAQLARRPVVYDTGFTLLPGDYTLKFLARDAETGRIGTYQTAFRIPNLNRAGDNRIPISAVVLGSQKVELKEALYNAVKTKERAETGNPLVQNGVKLIPSVTRVFRKDQNLYVYLQAYEQGPAVFQPLVARVSIYDGKTQALESEPVEVAQGEANRLKTAGLSFAIPLRKLAPGRYECQVTVLNPEGQAAAFWRAPMVVLP